MKIYCGIDPGFSGAWGMIDEHGKYVSCGDMINDGHFILAHHVWAEMSQARDRQDIEVVVEAVHAMPKQGVSSTFKFGMAYGAAISLAQRFNVHVSGVAPRIWKRDLKLDSDKDTSLLLARELWPNAPLARKKDNGRAEALLLAYWLRGEMA
jgi:hypothetical protein